LRGASRSFERFEPLDGGRLTLESRRDIFGSVPDDSPPESQTESVRERSTGDSPFSVIVSCANGVSVTSVGFARTLVIGRGESCEILVDDPSVSRKHAVLRLDASPTIEDLGSRNGTTVGLRRIAPGERVPIGVGTLVVVGSASVVLEPSHGLPSRAMRRARPSPRGVVARDPAMLRLYAMLDVLAPSDLRVLLLGETGVGKEIFAAEVHRRSRRRSAPFVVVHCAAIPASMLERELFGYEKGAFPGAAQDKEGLFEAAHGGTLLFDEIADLPPPIQAKLLRVIESGEVTRLGSIRRKLVDVRVLSATHRDLSALAESRSFRADLFFRLNGVTLTIPPLRERRGDIAPLAEHFAELSAARHGRAPVAISPEAIETLEQRPWPGNVRELRNVVERAVVLCPGSTLDPQHFAGEVGWRKPTARELDEGTGKGEGLPQRIASLEKKMVLEALEKTGGNQSRAAKLLGIPRRTLINRIEAFGIARPRKKPT
jgi:DNA-binding NtrC family response regulator